MKSGTHAGSLDHNPIHISFQFKSMSTLVYMSSIWSRICLNSIWILVYSKESVSLGDQVIPHPIGWLLSAGPSVENMGHYGGHMLVHIKIVG